VLYFCILKYFMKKSLLFCFFITAISFTNLSYAQGVAINTDGSTADPSAMLDIKSTNKGMLVPRVSSTSGISTPVIGLLVYQTSSPTGFYYYDGTTWLLLQNTVNGVPGPQGPQGVTGIAGPNGPQGPIGTSGPMGSTGPAGLSGSQGPIGSTGPAGPQGPIGATGSTGPTGPAGTTGATGATGIAGTGSIDIGFQYVALTSGSTTNAVTISNMTVRTVVGDLKGATGAGTTLTYTLPSAASYPAGTIITFEGTGYVPSVLASLIFISPSSTLSQVNINNASTASPGVNAGAVSKFAVVSDGVSHWYRYN